MTPWRESLKVHHATSLFPPLEPNQLTEVADAVGTNGLLHPVLAYKAGAIAEVIVDTLHIDDIVIGPRTSRDFGNIDSLAASIATAGLDRRLIASEGGGAPYRLRHCQHLLPFPRQKKLGRAREH